MSDLDDEFKEYVKERHGTIRRTIKSIRNMLIDIETELEEIADKTGFVDSDFWYDSGCSF